MGMLLAVALILGGCGGDSEENADRAVGGGDDDDIDIDPTDDDSTTDDDTTDDDDTTPDDDDDTIDDDDTSPVDDDDDNDDDTTVEPGWPYAVINSPAPGSTLTDYDVDIDADIYEVDDAENITVTIDDSDITGALTVSTTKVTGQITAQMGGPHVLQIEMTNNLGTRSDRSRFTINQPFIYVESPESGAYLNTPTIAIIAEYGQVDESTIEVQYDGADITGELSIVSGKINGELVGVGDGNHELVFTAETATGAKEQLQVTVPFCVEILPPHFDLSLSSYILLTGESVNVYYTFYNESGIDITDQVTVDITVPVGSGYAINGDTITFDEPGLCQISVGTAYGSGYYTASTWVLVEASPIVSLEIEASNSMPTAGETIFIFATVKDDQGNEIDWATVFYRAEPATGVTISEDEVTLTRAGDVTITGQVLGTSITDSVVVTVLPGAPVELKLYCDPPTVDVGASSTCAVELVDLYGNVIEDEPYTYTVIPSTGVTVLDDTFTFTQENYYVITATAVNYPLLNDSMAIQAISDTTPGIVITSPDRALYTSDTSVNVEGYIYNADLLDPDTVVTLNGAAIYYDWATGDFGPEEFVLVNGLNILEVVVVADDQTAKASTSVLYAKYEWPNDSVLTNAIGLRVTETGFDDFEAVIGSYVADINFEEIIMAQNPLFNESVEVWGVTLASAKAVVTGVEYDNPTVNFDPSSAALNTDAHLTNIVLDFNVTGTIVGIGYSISGYVSVDAVDLDTFTWVWYDPATGMILMDMDRFDVALSGFEIHIDGFPDELVDLFESQVEEAVEEAAEAALYAAIPPLLQDLLNDLPLDYDISISDGISLHLSGDATALDLDDTGMTTWMSAQITPSVINPLVRTMNGSLRTPSPKPVMESTIPNVGDAFNIGVVFDDDVINRLIYDLYRTGILHQDLEHALDACGDAFYLLMPEICDYYQVNPDDPVYLNIKLRPQLPPVFVTQPLDKSGTLETQIQIGDMFFYLETDATGSPETVLTLSAAAKVEAILSHDWDTNSLDIEFGDATVTIDTIDNPLSLTEGLFESIGPLLIELALPIIGELFDNFTLPTFDVGGDEYKLQIQHILFVGDSGDFLGAYGGLNLGK